MKLKWWQIVLGVVFVLFLIGKVAKNDESQSSDSTSHGASEEVVIDVDAKVLYNEYEANEISADSRYKGKKVTVTGVVTNIGNDIADNAYVVLGNDEYGITGVQCMIPDKSYVSRLSKGERITLTGRCSGKMINVLVRNCEPSLH